MPLEVELVERAEWLIRLRWVSAICIAAALALGWQLYPGQFPLLPLAAVVLAMLLYNALFFAYAKTLRLDPATPARPRQATHFVCVQILLDLLALAALIHLTGGVESPVTLALLLPAVAAGILLSRRTGFLVATLAVLLYVTIVGLQYVEFLIHYHPPVLESVELYRQTPYVLTIVIVLALTLWLVAYITSSISSSLRERERRLANTSSAVYI